MRTYNTSYMLYLSDEQREFLAKKSKEVGVSSAQYCRMLIQQQIESDKGVVNSPIDQFIGKKGE